MEIVLWVLTGAFALISGFGAVIYNTMRNEAKEHGCLLRQKVDSNRLIEMEARWKESLDKVEVNNRTLIDRLEARHDKEINELGSRLGEQINRSEANILTQIRLMMDALRTPR
jgi:hypothetical protein